MSQSDSPLAIGVWRVDDTIHRPGDGGSLLNLRQGSIRIDEIGAQRPIRYGQAFVQAVQKSTVSVKGQPGRIWRTARVVKCLLELVGAVALC